MVRNFIQIVADGLRLDGAAWLFVYILIAVGFSALIWWACTHYTKLWNKVYEVTPSFHVLCALAAVITFGATLGFIGLKNMRPVAEQMVAYWAEDVVEDVGLSQTCFRDAYYAIKDAGLEDMRGYRTPESGGDLIPISRKETQILVGQIYAGNACRDFSARYPLIGHFLKAEEGVPAEIIARDVNVFFRSGRGRTYPLEQGFVLAIEKISSDLQSQCGRIVRTCRGWLVLLFFLVQLIPFALIGYLAYKELSLMKRAGRPSEYEGMDFYADNI